MDGNAMKHNILQNIKTFFGEKQNEKDEEKYAKVLLALDFPDLDDNETDEIFKEAQRILKEQYAVGRKPRYTSCFAVKKLGRGKKKESSLCELEPQLLRTAVRMANTLAAYEEDIAISLFQDSSSPEETNLKLVLSFEDQDETAPEALVRSVYGNAVLERVDVPSPLSETIYGRIQISDPGGQKEQAKKETAVEKYVSWITAVALAMPSGCRYRVQLRLFPLGRDDESVRKRIGELEEIYNELQFHSEINWNTATNLGINYSRQENLGEHISDKVKLKGVIQGKESISSSYACNLGMARSRKDKRSEYFMKRIDRELTRLRAAQQSMVWQAEISVSAEEESILQAAACAMAGALKPSGMELTWEEQPAAALVAGTKEMLPLMLFPTKEFAGFEFVENEEFSLTSPSSENTGLDIGNILWNGKPVSTFFLPKQALNRHAFICGMTGAGKTNTVFKIMEEIALPYLVIEPVKGEYRSLQRKNPDVKIWTTKSGEGLSANVRMLRINPFWFPEHGNLAFHVDSIKTILASAFEMSAAMPNILEQCLYNVYVKTGWDFITNRNIYEGQVPEEFLYPTFSDLYKEIDDYLDHAEFGDEVLGNYRGAMSTRMKSFINGFKGILLNTKEHPDYEQMMNGCNIIELEGLADDADKCLVMGTILVQYYEYLKLHFQDTGKQLKHITVIEEAHRLFKNVQKKGNTENGADVVGQLVDSLSNIMAEIRAFGEGLLVVDQSPTKIAEDVIKNSGSKLIHRIDNQEDIKVIQASLLLSDDKTSLPALLQGETLIRTEGMTRPCKVRIHRSEIKEGYSLSESFQSEGMADGELGIIFAVTAILADETVKRQTEHCVKQFLLVLAQSKLDEWYVTTNHLMLDLIGILQQWRKYDMVDCRLSVLFEIISQTVKVMREGLSVREVGRLHLFIMRMMALYREQKEGYFVKDAAVELLRQYMNREIVPEILPMLEESEYS